MGLGKLADERIGRHAHEALAELTEILGDRSGDQAAFAKANEAVRRLLDWITSTLGPSAARQLEDYAGSYPAEPSSSHRAFLWSQLLWRLVFGARRGDTSEPLSLRNEKAAVIAQAVEEHLDRERWVTWWMTRFNEEAAAPPSHHDLAQLVGDENLDLDLGYQLLEWYSFGRAWEKIIAALDTDERAMFLDWARRQARLMSLPVDLIDMPDRASRLSN